MNKIENALVETKNALDKLKDVAIDMRENLAGYPSAETCARQILSYVMDSYKQVDHAGKCVEKQDKEALEKAEREAAKEKPEAKSE